MSVDLYIKLKEAYEISSKRFNEFADFINGIKWDERFEVDGEMYFIKGDLTLIVEDLNPFKERWKPVAIFKDGSVIEF